MNQIEEPEGQNPLGPADHFPEYQNMDVDDDPDPEMPPSGTPTHPIETSSGSSFHGGHATATTSARAATASRTIGATKNCTDVRAWGFPFQHPQHSSNSNYPPIQDDPQMGGPSNAISEVDSAPVAPAPPMGYENPIPSYPGAAGYNPFEQQAYSGYNYNNAPTVDPYIEAANFNALYPGPFPPTYPTGYPAYGYQYPPPPQLQ
ncbi:programmed cell death 6-interacting protein-like [Helianthus annuus]|uniref:programmed cell death 6-interacting protein-like n=1 Tax=Helianthus annuus TaxID=4232 RepID=UPI000B90A1E5|nr:programmed cell death 6-interacting protein-like [Helianthus annuus]